MEGAGEVSCHCNPCTELDQSRISLEELTQSATWVLVVGSFSWIECTTSENLTHVLRTRCLRPRPALCLSSVSFLVPQSFRDSPPCLSSASPVFFAVFPSRRFLSLILSSHTLAQRLSRIVFLSHHPRLSRIRDWLSSVTHLGPISRRALIGVRNFDKYKVNSSIY